MKANCKCILTGLIAFFALSAFSQSRIYGVVTDENDNALVGATAKLSMTDSTFVGGVTSKADGSFMLTDVKAGSYVVSISYIGYKTYNTVVRNLHTDINIGNVSLIPSAQSLKDVVVTGSGTIDQIDRQILIPSNTQIEASNNGVSLLQHLQLSDITVNSINNKITTLTGQGVQLRINGVIATVSEITAIQPHDVTRIEYHDMPGLRYGNVPAVLDFIVKYKNDGGNVSANITEGISMFGMGDDNLSAGYHSGKSSVKFVGDLSRRDYKWLRADNENFNGSSPAISNIEMALPTKTQTAEANMALSYNYETAKSMLSLTFRDRLNDTPHSTEDRQNLMSQGEYTYKITDLQHSNENSPSLDLYYQREFNKNSNLYVDVVGTFIKSNSDRTYTMDDGINQPDAVLSTVHGNKYSVVGEAIYEQLFNKAKLSFGLKHIQAYMDNTYDGDMNTKVSMTTAETYAYSEFMGKAHALTYTLGLGLMRTYNNQDGNSQESYIFRPNMALSYDFSKSFTLRWNGYISGYSPSLADLSNVSQQIDTYQIRRGNPDLKSVWYVSTTIMADWRSKYVSAELFGRYSFDHKPLMEETLYEDGMYIRTIENQKGFHRLSAFLGLKFTPWKDYLSIQITPFLNWYSGKGNNYSHSYSNWGINGNLTATYKHWQFMADFATNYYELWGETLTKNQNGHSVAVGYNTNKWGLQLQFLNPFISRYSQEVDNLSALAPYKQYAYTTALSRVLMVNFSFNLDFGKKGSSKGKKIYNSDSDTGVVTGRQ